MRKDDLTTKEIEYVSKQSKQQNIIDFKTALKLFIDDCELRNLRPDTLHYYNNELGQFYKILRSQNVDTTPDNITLHIIKDKAIRYMLKVEKLKPTTINTRLRAAKAFFNFLFRENFIKNNPAKGLKELKSRRAIVETFTNEQLEKLFKQPNLRTFRGIRDYTIMLVLLDTGIRLSEIEALDTYDIKWTDKMLHVRATKGFRERLVPLSDETINQLKTYLRIRGVIEDTDALFVNLKSGRMLKRNYQAAIKRYGNMAEIKNVRCSPHTFRHTMAKLSVKNGAGIFDLQSILGHTNLEMVRIYVNLFATDVQEKHNKFSPVKQLKNKFHN